MTTEATCEPAASGMPPATAPDLDTRIATRDPQRRRAERVMGTVISLVAPDGGADSGAADRAFDWLHEADRRFSPFRADSEVSHMMRAAVAADRLDTEGAATGPSSSALAVSADLADVLELCEIVTALSDGAFDIRHHRPDGAPDPTAVVKGWAVDRAATILSEGGMERFCFGAGGDVLARGGRHRGVPWRIGIAHPTERRSISLTLEAEDLAVATSGSTERGQHIVDGRTGAVPRELVAVSVAGPDLARADAYATAAFALDEVGLRWVDALPGYAACGATRDGRLLVTRGLERSLTGR